MHVDEKKEKKQRLGPRRLQRKEIKFEQKTCAKRNPDKFNVSSGHTEAEHMIVMLCRNIYRWTATPCTGPGDLHKVVACPTCSVTVTRPRGMLLDTSHLGWRLLRCCLYSKTPGVYVSFATVSAVCSCTGVCVGFLACRRSAVELLDPHARLQDGHRVAVSLSYMLIVLTAP